MPRSSKTATLDAAAIRRATARTRSSSTPATSQNRDTGTSAVIDHFVETDGVLGQPGPVQKVLLHRDRAERGEAPGVGAGAHLKVEVRELGGLGAAGIDDDQRPGRVAGDLFQRRPRPGDAVRLPRVLADEHRHLGVLEVGAHHGAEELGVDEELARLLLGQRVGLERGAERGAGRARVPAAEMVPLAAAAVIEDRRPTPRVSDVPEPGRNFGDRGVPVDLLERAVVAAPERGRQPVAAVLVVVEAQGLLAGVALRRRVGLVAADAFEAAAVVTSEPDLDSAVSLAQDARRRMPLRAAAVVLWHARPP